MLRSAAWSAVTAAALCCALPHAAQAAPECREVVGRSSSWTWCEGRLTRLSPAERARLTTAEPPTIGESGEAHAAPPSHRGPPGGSPTDVAFSWHDLGGSDWMTGVRDQGSCGSCFVFGSLASVESQYKWLVGDPLLEVDLSEQAVISCINMGSCDEGGMSQEVGMHLKSPGVPDEACYPYAASNGNCASVCADSAERVGVVTDWHMSTIPWSVAELKAQLVFGPMAVNMQVYDDFYGYSSGVYSRSGSAEASGWHIVSLVGWDDAEQSWIAKNSWGEDFGQDGYFRISQESDCLVFITGTCFASNITHFDVDNANVPGLACASTHELAFEADEGQVAMPASLEVRNCGFRSAIRLAGETSPAAPWLSFAAAEQSISVGGVTNVEVTASALELAPGLHETTLRLTGGSGTSSVRVTFNVRDVPDPPGEGGTGTGGSAQGGTPSPPKPRSNGGEEEGCGCRLGASPSRGPVGLGLLVAAAAAARLRRRARLGRPA